MTKENMTQISYEDAGVSTAAGARAVEGIREAVRSTYRPEVIGDIGGFGGLFSLSAIKDMDDPIMVSGTDGVGTKIELARLLNKHDSIGIDLVAMCANDIIVTGAEPLFFLDYIAIGKLDEAHVASVVGGIAEGCRQAGASLVGGEMAEHPGVMDDDAYDLSGFCTGVVDRAKMIDGIKLASGDVIIGLESSGIHSNGFSLVRRVVLSGDAEVDRAALNTHYSDEDSRTLGEALLAPTRIYVKTVLALLREHGLELKAIAHITGGGITENLNRVLPAKLDAQVKLSSLPKLPVIEYVSARAGLSMSEKLKTFNCGIGLALVVDSAEVERTLNALDALGEHATVIGEVVDGSGEVVYLD